MRKLIMLSATLLLLCACNSGLSAEEVSSNTDISAKAPLDTPLQDVAVSEDSYNEAVDAYNEFLNGDMYYLDGERNVSLSPSSEFYYTILDLNDDGVPELATTMAFHQYRDTSLNIQETYPECAIFAFGNSTITKWYSGSSRYNFGILRNHALLYEYGDSSQLFYEYIELRSDGSTSCYKKIYKIQQYSSGVEEWSYFIDDGESMKEISETEWEFLLAPYLELRSNNIQWSLNPQMEPKGQGDGSLEPVAGVIVDGTRGDGSSVLAIIPGATAGGIGGRQKNRPLVLKMSVGPKSTKSGAVYGL